MTLGGSAHRLLISTECFPCMSYMLAWHPRLHLNRALITPTVFVYYWASSCARLPLLLGEYFRRVKNGLLIISSSEQMSRRNDPYSSPTNPLFSSRYVCWEKRVKLRIRRSSPLRFFSTGWRKAASSGGWETEMGGISSEKLQIF